MTAKRLKEIEKLLKAKEAEITLLEDEQRTLLGAKSIQCPHCNKKTKVSQMSVIEHYTYGFDNWERNEHRYSLWCDHCKQENTVTPNMYGSTSKADIEEDKLFKFVKANLYNFKEILKFEKGMYMAYIDERSVKRMRERA